MGEGRLDSPKFLFLISVLSVLSDHFISLPPFPYMYKELTTTKGWIWTYNDDQKDQYSLNVNIVYIYIYT